MIHDAAVMWPRPFLPRLSLPSGLSLPFGPLGPLGPSIVPHAVRVAGRAR
jgi:hypothetical protein